jgi:hypothetical protein
VKIAIACALAALSAFAPPAEVCGCALAPRAGDSVHVAEESAVIVWDVATKTQHFVRRAQFDTKAQDFGFLVPTPTRPVLAEAQDAVFGYLLDLTRPPLWAALAPAAAKGERVATAKSEPPRAAVIVLEAVTVAGLDAVVLDANDAQALNSWLGKHGYAASAQLADWYKPYIASKWIITAFKISKGSSHAGRATTSAVRMSFRTEQPFFPYREPATSGTTPRALEVYFIARERAEGRIGAAPKPAPGIYERLLAMVGLGGRTSGWPGHTLWAKPLPEGARRDLLERLKLPATAIPASAWLTRFLDSSSPRPGMDDLFFSRADDQSPYMDERRLNEELSRKESMKFSASSESMPRQPPTRAQREAPGDEAAANYALGVDLENQGKAQDAIRLYRRAARGGSGKAAKRLGEIFDKGVPGVSRDHAESLQWYQTARDLGEEVEPAKPR